MWADNLNDTNMTTFLLAPGADSFLPIYQFMFDYTEFTFTYEKSFKNYGNQTLNDV